MRTSQRRLPLALLVTGALVAGLGACAGAGRPSAQDVLERLNAAGVPCEVQGTPLALPGGGRTESSCLTRDGREIGVSTYSSDDAQKRFLDTSGGLLRSSVFPVVVSDYGYLLFVPERELGTRVANVMDARALGTGARDCPTARGGLCGTAPLGGPTSLGGTS